MSDSISTPNFIVIEPQTIKLGRGGGGGGGGIMPPYCSVFKIAHTE